MMTADYKRGFADAKKRAREVVLSMARIFGGERTTHNEQMMAKAIAAGVRKLKLG